MGQSTGIYRDKQMINGNGKIPTDADFMDITLTGLRNSFITLGEWYMDAYYAYPYNMRGTNHARIYVGREKGYWRASQRG